MSEQPDFMQTTYDLGLSGFQLRTASSMFDGVYVTMTQSTPYEDVAAMIRRVAEMKGEPMPPPSKLHHLQTEINRFTGGPGHIALIQRGPGELELKAVSLVGYLLMGYATGVLPKETLPDWGLVEQDMQTTRMAEAGRQDYRALLGVEATLRADEISSADRVRSAVATIDQWRGERERG